MPEEAPRYAQGSCNIAHRDYGLLRFFWTNENCRSFLDVGCGPGGQVELARAMGYRGIGLEVDPAMYRRADVALIDCCIKPVTLPSPADLVWSVETAEHIPPECVDAYLDTLTGNARSVIVMTASQIEMPLHVSVHPLDWWQEKMRAKGWSIDQSGQEIIWKHSTMDREFLRETGMIFRKEAHHAEDTTGWVVG